MKRGDTLIRKEAFLALILILALAAVSGCATNSPAAGNSSATDKYVALEEIQKTYCTLISGSYGLPGHITFPVVFNYDGSDNGSNWADGSGWANARRSLDGYYPAVNGSLKVLLGTYYYRDRSPGDTSIGLRVRGVYSLPYVLDSGFVLRDVDGNGTIYGSYNDTSIVLRSGEQWMSPASIEVRGGSGKDLDQKPFSWTASFNTTWTIANLGALDKSNLTRYKNSALATGYSEGY
jgi:hypothetical protein